MATAEDAVESARRGGLNVVAAAGNHGGPVDWPAGYPPVFAVGAANDQGQRCSFAASGSEVDLWAPGCPVDVASADGAAAFASGSSESAAFVAGVLAQLRQSDPALGADAAESVVRGSGRAAAVGSMLDVGAAFVYANLGDQLTSGRRLTPPAPSSALEPAVAPVRQQTSAGSSRVPEDSPASSTAPTSIAFFSISRRLPRPVVARGVVRGAVANGVLTNKGPGVEATVAVYARRGHDSLPRLVKTVRLKTRRLRIRTRGTISEMSITYLDPTRLRAQSAPLILLPRR
jgi:hypothetical protein